MISLNIVLVEPEIPPNTGNVARLCAATNSTLHLVHPLGFNTDDKALKRAGLDYWKFVKVIHHRSLEEFLNSVAEKSKMFLFSTRAKSPYTHAKFFHDAYLLFGKETFGLPRWLVERYFNQSFYIPMWGKTRSLNLSTAVGIVTYHAYSQLFSNFEGFQPKPDPDRD